jgi:hypothetical protein
MKFNFNVVPFVGRKSQVTSLFLTASLCVSMFTSCKDETMNEVAKTVQTESATKTGELIMNDKTSFQNGRLVFRNSQEYWETITYLFNHPEKEAKNLFETAKNPNFVALSTDMKANPEKRKSADLDFLSPPMKKLLNANQEIQIGDTLVWYANGQKYMVLQNDEKQLAALKQGTAKADLQFAATAPMQNPTDKKGNIATTQGYISPGGVDETWSYIYSPSPSIGGQRKIRFVMATSVDRSGSSNYVWVYTQIDIQYWSNGYQSWQQGGETMSMSINNLRMYTVAGGYVYSDTGSSGFNVNPLTRTGTGNQLAVLLHNKSYSGYVNAIYVFLTSNSYNATVLNSGHSQGAFSVATLW